MMRTPCPDEILRELQYPSPKAFAPAVNTILSNLKSVNNDLAMKFSPNDCDEQWDQPLTYPSQISRTVSSDEAPRVVDLVLLHSSFGTYKERTAFANNMRRQIESGMLHLNDLVARINCDFTQRRSDLRLSVRTSNIESIVDFPDRGKMPRFIRSIEFILSDKHGATIDSIKVSGPTVA